MANKLYLSRTVLTGGTAYALDYLDGSDLSDGDIALVMVGGILYVYRLNASSAAAEASPAVIAPDTNAGDKRWILEESRSIAVGSDADGDTYYRASGVLARLAKGTANHKMFMNAAGTGPEWAKGIHIMTFTRALDGASGDVAYTGVGFKPSAIIFFANFPNSAIVSYGMDFQSARQAHYQVSAAIYGPMSTTASIYMYEGSGKVQEGYIKSWDADGFTVTWTRTGATSSGNITISAIVLR